MKGMIFTVVLVRGAILAAYSPAAPKEAMTSIQSLSPSPTEGPADETLGKAYHKITVEEAKQMVNGGNTMVVDMHTAEEYTARHIPGSILIPVESAGDTKPVELPGVEAVFSAHYHTNIRSKRASDQLVELGYKHVYNFGGVADWPHETIAEDQFILEQLNIASLYIGLKNGCSATFII